jgi:hypothetical protein
MYFLIDYDRSAGKLMSMTPFDANQGALARSQRLALELEHNAAGRIREVVILQAPSEAHIRKTHRRYFETLEELVKLAG